MRKSKTPFVSNNKPPNKQPGRVIRIAEINASPNLDSNGGRGGLRSKSQSLDRQIIIFSLIVVGSWIASTGLLIGGIGMQKWKVSASCLAGVVVQFRFCKWAARELLNYHRMQKEIAEKVEAINYSATPRTVIEMIKALVKEVN